MELEILQFQLANGAGEATIGKLLKFAQLNGVDRTREICRTPILLVSHLGIASNVAERIVSLRNQAQQLADELTTNKIRILWLGHVNYPKRLSKILQQDAPPILYVKGNIDLFESNAVGFCGSREVSEKGLVITRKCSSQLVQRNYCIISGYAHGTDMAAHIAAVENGGKTVFVLAEGILRFEVKKPVRGLLTDNNHLIVSQFSPMLTWIAHNAMKRNSTIIGLSDAMILVESGINGGTFAAGDETLKRKQPLFVIDYKHPGPSAEANPYFIGKGGKPIRGNKGGTPNLRALFAATSNPLWKYITVEEHSLFNMA